MEWFYVDTAGSEFGPFEGERMRAWFDSGLFHATGDELQVRLREWKMHRSISSVYGGDRAAYFTGKITDNGGSGGRRSRHRKDRSASSRSSGSGSSMSRSRSRKRSRSRCRSRGRRRRRDRRTHRNADRISPPKPSQSPNVQPASQYPPASFFQASPNASGLLHEYGGGYGSPWGTPPPPGSSFGPGMPLGSPGAAWEPWRQPPVFMHPFAPGMPPAPPGYPSAWAAPPPPAFGFLPPPGPFGHGAPWGPLGHPAQGSHAIEDRHRKGSPRRGGDGGGGSREQADDRAVLEKLGRDGIRDLLSGALESLYKDRIKPLANYVRGRLKERSAAQIVLKTFAELYAEHSDLFIVERPAAKKEGQSGSPPTTAGNADERIEEVAILFVEAPSFFKGWVDIDSPEDPFDEAVWIGLKEFLDTGHSFGGGRYGMARDIMQRNLPCLSEMCLGEVCHVVQLAIQKRKILVYHRKMLKSTSLAMPNDSAIGDGPAEDVEDITDMHQLCKVLFKMHARYASGIRLDRLKRVMKEEFGCRLNEMAFQCTKLIELFKKEPLCDTFEVCADKKAFILRLREPTKFTGKIQELYMASLSAAADGKKT